MAVKRNSPKPSAPPPRREAEPRATRRNGVEPTGDVFEENPAETSLVDDAYHQILLRIIRGELSGGDELKSTQLADALGTSRTPVVQALQRLAVDGIVSLELNKRAVVRPGAENWLMEIHQMRELLEPHAAGLAAERISPEDVAALRALSQESKPGSHPQWLAAARRFDYALHLAIADACGNLALGAALRKCWSFKRLSYAAATDSAEAATRGYHEHLAILSALEARDARTAQAAVLFHLRSAVASRPAARIV